MRKVFVLGFLLLPLLSISQTGPKQYWIQFSDKSNTPFSLNDPLEFLSQRALDRREAQSITLTTSDLPVDPVYIQNVLNQGASYLTHSKWFNSVSVFVPNASVLDAIMQLPFVVQTEAVGKMKKVIEVGDKLTLTTSKSIDKSQVSESDYGAAFNQIDMIGGISLHNQGCMGQGMLIAILDAGFINADVVSVLDSLRNDNRIVGKWDFVARDDSVFAHSSHGLSVLSTMAAYDPGNMIGTAPLAGYVLLRTEDGDSEFPIEEDYWVAGAEYADSAGADIINSSLGYTTFENPVFNHTYADMDGNTTRGATGADIAASKGILVVNSAGNSGSIPWQYIGTPADGDSVLAIGAVDSLGFIANFSSIGPSADGDVKPNVCAQGALATVVNSSGAVVRNNGTSFSGPIIAGMSACLWQMFTDSATNMDVFHAIEESAHLYHNPDYLYGYGIPNFSMAHLILSGFVPDDMNKDQLLSVFPNPFVDVVEGAFYSSSNQHVVIRIVNSLGQEIQRQEGEVGNSKATPFSFSGLQNLNSAVYYLQVQTDTEKHQQKLVKLVE